MVAERLFREIGYQKTTVADIAKVLRMSPANVYRFFDSKKAIHEGVARAMMGEVEDAAEAIAAGRGSAASRLRELVTAIHRMNSERYVGDSKLHEMVEIAMEESWEVCVAHMQRLTETIARVIAEGVASGEFEAPDVPLAAMCVCTGDDAILSSADDRPDRQQAGTVAGPDGRLYPRGTDLARQGRQVRLIPSLRAQAKQSMVAA